MCFGSKTTAKNASITMFFPQVWHIYLARSLLSKHLKKILDSVFCLRSLKLLKFVEITKRTKSNSIPKSAS